MNEYKIITMNNLQIKNITNKGYWSSYHYLCDICNCLNSPYLEFSAEHDDKYITARICFRCMKRILKEKPIPINEIII